MTEKQKRFADEYLIDLNNVFAFKTHNFKYVENPLDIIINSIAVLIGEYSYERKQASVVLLKALLTEKFYLFLFEDRSLYPVSRNDYRVVRWKNKVISIGKCEKCGETKNLEAHHIVKWSDYPAGRIDENNGICLCLKCHANEHMYDRSFHLMEGKLIKKTQSRRVKVST